jgi:hypothetical protein
MEDVFAESNPVSKEDETKRKRRKAREVNDLRDILALPQGRRYIWKLWGLTGVFRASYAPKDSNLTAFREGQRDIGLALLQDINEASPTALGQMRSEYLSELNSEKKVEEEDND